MIKSIVFTNHAKIVFHRRLADQAHQLARHNRLHPRGSDQSQQTRHKHVVFTLQQPVGIEQRGQQQGCYNFAVFEQVTNTCGPFAQHQQGLNITERSGTAWIEMVGATLLDALGQPCQGILGISVTQPFQACLVDYA